MEKETKEERRAGAGRVPGSLGRGVLSPTWVRSPNVRLLTGLMRGLQGGRALGTCLWPPLSALYFLFMAPQAVLGSKALNSVHRLDVGERRGERGLRPG